MFHFTLSTKHQLGSTSVKELFDLIFIKQDVEYDLLDQTRVLLYRPKSTKISISGVIRDYESKESIPAATIFIQETGEYVVATDDGYFYLESEGLDSLTLSFSSLTYTKKQIVKSKSENKLVVELQANLDGPLIIITPIVVPNDYIQKPTPEGFSPLGLAEITEKIKINPMVQNGNEGQLGFVVKGGSTDQNLILVDGMPIYNVSHIGGLSSIFISSAVKDVKLHTSGISAQYGGKLSSVMDLKIKEGNTSEFHGKLTTGINGTEAHFEGPLIKNKTALSVSGRYSWLNILSSSFFEKYEDSAINYYDAYAKLHHKFSPTNRISLSYYKGSDRLFLLTENENQLPLGPPASSASHNFNWGSELMSLQWNWLISSSLSMNSKVGFSEYKLRGEGAYEAFNINEEEVLTDITASSGIRDIVASTKFDVYNTSVGKLNFGANAILHSFQPELREKQVVAGVPIKDNGGAGVKSEALELNAFIENDVELGDRVKFRGGLHFSRFSDQDTSYFIIEPRAKFSWQKNKHHVDLNLTINHQYIHLLTNPGTGLPSDLWVPSSRNISPAKSQELSINYNYKFNDEWSISSQAYVKNLTSIKGYATTSDIIFAVLGESVNLGQFVTSDPDWRSRIQEGRGFSTGIGALLKYEKDRLKFLSSYTYSHTVHQFITGDNNLNELFYARHHRPHDILCQASYELTDAWSTSVKFVYGTGIRYTFPDEYIPGPPAKFNARARNLQTLDAFHHLDLNFKYRKQLEFALMDLNFGAYNVYNRENIFFTYLNLDDLSEPKQEKIGIIRLLPHISLSISF